MSRRGRRRDRVRQAGMTLVEVIVAMAVLSLVVLALGASLRGISRSAERVEERVDAVDELRVGAAFLRELFSRALVLQVPGPPRQLLFDAQAGSLAWVAVMPARFGAAGRYTFRLAAEPAADGTQALVLRYAPLGSGAPVFPDWATTESRVLAAKVDQLQFGFGGEGMARGWQPAWADADKLPLRVRIDVATAEGPWPPLVLPLRTPPVGAFFSIGGAR